MDFINIGCIIGDIYTDWTDKYMINIDNEINWDHDIIIYITYNNESIKKRFYNVNRFMFIYIITTKEVKIRSPGNICIYGKYNNTYKYMIVYNMNKKIEIYINSECSYKIITYSMDELDDTNINKYWSDIKYILTKNKIYDSYIKGGNCSLSISFPIELYSCINKSNDKSNDITKCEYCFICTNIYISYNKIKLEDPLEYIYCEMLEEIEIIITSDIKVIMGVYCTDNMTECYKLSVRTIYINNDIININTKDKRKMLLLLRYLLNTLNVYKLYISNIPTNLMKYLDKRGYYILEKTGIIT